MDLQTQQQSIIAEFQACTEWTDRMKLLIRKGETLCSMNEMEKSDCVVIKNCQTTMWVRICERDGELEFCGDSDSKTMRGIMALCFEALKGANKELLASVEFSFLEEIGLDAIVTSNRSTGLDELLLALRNPQSLRD